MKNNSESFAELTQQAADYVNKSIKGRLLSGSTTLLEIITKSGATLPNGLTEILPKEAGVMRSKFFTVSRFYLFKPLTEQEEKILHSYIEKEEVVAYSFNQPKN
jgi:hypothetical protein